MDATGIDHVNLRIPEDAVEEVREFYVDALGFSLEGLDRYRDGEKSFYTVRLGEDCVVHLRPDESFETPPGTGYDHLAVRVDADIDAVKTRLDAHGVVVEQELEPLGATGVAPAVYVRDPFGYLLELKADD